MYVTSTEPSTKELLCRHVCTLTSLYTGQEHYWLELIPAKKYSLLNIRLKKGLTKYLKVYVDFSVNLNFVAVFVNFSWITKLAKNMTNNTVKIFISMLRSRYSCTATA